MCSVLERVVLCAGEIVRETEGSREMGIVDSLRWVVMERMAGERGMGQRDEGWRRDGSWTRRRWRRVAGAAGSNFMLKLAAKFGMVKY
ncbi:hypothetical protein MRB53_032579 [Persea americana]|uniref:Uncharacterized protein n=1 Tax=Persea americana TaxID=3435 RepID=A0ACC2KS81_PERAE|nr:hypothetical protein MRB53_032579 [Persea americana]